MRRTLAFLCLVFAVAGQREVVGQRSGASQRATQSPGEISTDRPDISDSTDVVGRGLWQIELGVSLRSDVHDGVSERELAVPLGMVRMGLGRRLELRVSADGALSDTTAGVSGRVTGRSDMQVGAKWKLAEQPRGGFLFALEPVLSLPTGSDAFTSGGYDPTLKVIVDRELPQDISMSANIVVSSLMEDDRRFAQLGISLSLARRLVAGWTGFAEVYRASALVRNGHPAWLGDIGAVHALGARAQIDVSVGRGLNATAPDWFIGAGFALRGSLVR